MSSHWADAVWRSIQILITKVLTTFYRRAIIVARSLHNEIPNLQPCLPVTIAVLTGKDLPAYHQFRPDQNMTLIQGRLERGDRCYVAWHEGRIVHAAWVCTKDIYDPYLRRTLLLQPGDIRIYDSYTLPAYRRHGLAHTRGIHVLRQYQEEGFRRSTAIVALENKGSLGEVKVLGYHPIGIFRCVRLGSWQWDWEEAWSDEPLPILTKKGLKR